ncbi:hypothetical protein NUM3379_02340 [Kineococcus sp. NUM-3379]
MGVEWWWLVVAAVPLLWYLLALVASWFDAAEERAALRERRRLPAPPLPPPAEHRTLAQVTVLAEGLPESYTHAARDLADLLDTLETESAQPWLAEHEHELHVLRTTLLEVTRGLRSVPADLREVPGGADGSTPLSEALSVLERLRQGSVRLRTDVYAEVADRLRVLRRYTDGRYERSALDPTPGTPPGLPPATPPGLPPATPPGLPPGPAPGTRSRDGDPA